MTRTLNELKQIFLQAHTEIVNENITLCLDTTTAMLTENEALAKKGIKELKDICKEKLKTFNVSAEELEIINSNHTEWMKDTIPFLISKLNELNIGVTKDED